MALSNNDTDWNVFFASAGGGKTLKTKIISTPTKDIRWISTHRYPHLEVMYMSLGGQTRPGVLIPVFIASDDNRGTFRKAITLNSTAPP